MNDDKVEVHGLLAELGYLKLENYTGDYGNSEALKKIYDEAR